MATVRHLGLFALRNVFIGTAQNYLQGLNRCVQPASAFTETTIDGVLRSIAPASLPQSTYTLVDLERAMLWMWRIKTFTVTSSVVVDDSEAETQYNIAVPSLSVPNVDRDSFSSPAARSELVSERQKVCDCGWFYGTYESGDFDDGEIGSYQVNVHIADLQSMWVNYPNTPRLAFSRTGQRVRSDQDSDDYYIPVYLNVSVQGLSTGFSYSSGSANTADPGADKAIAWEITDLLGTTSRPFRYGSTNASGTISITATEYWPYDPGDGLGPIYDSATGAQLRAFPS